MVAAAAAQGSAAGRPSDSPVPSPTLRTRGVREAQCRAASEVAARAGAHTCAWLQGAGSPAAGLQAFVAALDGAAAAAAAVKAAAAAAAAGAAAAVAAAVAAAAVAAAAEAAAAVVADVQQVAGAHAARLHAAVSARRLPRSSAWRAART
eukprot:91416-Chlamydomonas_euryale.AAC.10